MRPRRCICRIVRWTMWRRWRLRVSSLRMPRSRARAVADPASAFNLFDFVWRKVPAVAGAFFCVIAGVFEGGFEDVRFLYGVFVVMLWWIRGELWSVDDLFEIFLQLFRFGRFTALTHDVANCV